MKRRNIAALAAVIAAAVSAPAFAQGWYAGAGIGSGKVKISAAEVGLSSGLLDDKDTTFGGKVGYEFTRNIAVEGNYIDLGKYEFSGLLGPFPASGEAKVRTYNVSVVGLLPFGERDQFAGYGKVGYAKTRVRANANVAGFSGSGSDSDSEATYGLGFRYMPAKEWGLYAEWNRLHDTQIEAYTVGALVRF